MFGYVKPLSAELKMRETETYRALYCGLCRCMKRHTGCLSTLGLRYEYVFLALVRMALSGSAADKRLRRCALHPVRRRPMAAENPELLYAARIGAFLTAEKLRDDRGDERGWRRLGAAAALPVAGRSSRRADLPSELRERLTASLTRLTGLEKNLCDSLDDTADCSGALLAEVFSFGLEGAEARIAHEIGYHTGRFIYVADACDDAAEDGRLGRYNPVLRRYGDDALTGEGKESRLTPAVIAELQTALRLDLSALASAAELLPGGDRDVYGILRNTVYLGMPAAAERIFCGRRKQTKEKI